MTDYMEKLEPKVSLDEFEGVVNEDMLARMIAKRTGRTIKSSAEFTRDFLDTLAELVRMQRPVKIYGYFNIDYTPYKERLIPDPTDRSRMVVVPEFVVPRLRFAKSIYR